MSPAPEGSSRKKAIMQEYIWVTGIILKQSPAGEYDRRVSILTRERGKLSAFAKGARKQGSRLAAGTNPFSFGSFKLFEGRNSYTVLETDIRNYFQELRTDYIGACYGMYFAEVADYCTREGNDEREMMKLLYQSLRALCAASLPNALVRCVFECRAMTVNGEFPRDFSQETARSVLGLEGALDSTLYALRYITSSPVERLYTFAVTDEVLRQLQQVAGRYMKRFSGHAFKSLEVLQTLC